MTVAAPSARARRRERLMAARLYLVCDSRADAGDLAAFLDAALSGGVDVVQLRDKGLDDDALLRAAALSRRACDRHGALFVLNDRPDLVGACGADGVHIGQDDTPPERAREQVGANALIGLSTHSPEQVDAANEQAIDYIGVGPLHATPTKPGRPAVGLELVRHAAGHAAHPFFAIGGIDASNVDDVVAAGATRLAVVRAIANAADPAAAARRLRAALAPTPPGAGAAR